MGYQCRMGLVIDRDLDQVLAGVLRPARSRQAEVEEVVAALERATLAERTARHNAIAGCIDRIEALRAEVFAAGTGLVPVEMTELERTYLGLVGEARSADRRAASRLWNDLAPPSWRTRPAPATVVAVVALTSDPEGVDAAEAAIARLRDAAAAWHLDLGAAGAPITWRVGDSPLPLEPTAGILAGPWAELGAALDDAGLAEARAGREQRIRDRVAEQLREPAGVDEAVIGAVTGAALGALAWAMASEAGLRRADQVEVAALADPFAPLLDVWSTGHVPAAIGPDRARLDTLTVPR